MSFQSRMDIKGSGGKTPAALIRSNPAGLAKPSSGGRNPTQRDIQGSVFSLQLACVRTSGLGYTWQVPQNCRDSLSPLAIRLSRGRLSGGPVSLAWVCGLLVWVKALGLGWFVPARSELGEAGDLIGDELLFHHAAPMIKIIKNPTNHEVLLIP